MRLSTFLAPLLAAALAFWPASDTRADAGAIEMVITDQIGAFQRDDVTAAFRHASPNIQRIFRNPENFGQMVRRGYPMVWRPAEFRMMALGQTPEGLMQKVLFIDQAGQAWEADYRMIEVEGRWRIDGVWLRALPGVAS